MWWFHNGSLKMANLGVSIPCISEMLQIRVLGVLGSQVKPSPAHHWTLLFHHLMWLLKSWLSVCPVFENTLTTPTPNTLNLFLRSFLASFVLRLKNLIPDLCFIIYWCSYLVIIKQKSMFYTLIMVQDSALKNKIFLKVNLKTSV